MSEQLIPLSDEDRELLTKSRTFGIKWMFVTTIGAVLFSLGLIFFHSLVVVVLLVVCSVVLLATTAGGFFIFRSASKDLRFGQKQMISGPVEAQNIDVTRTTDKNGVESDATYRFWIQIGGKKVTVSEDQYYQFKKGDLAEAFIAPHSETVLGVNKETLRRPFA